MRIAVPHWQGRVSPVFDVAGVLLLVNVDQGQETSRQNIVLENDSSLTRTNYMKELDIDAIICGAVSKPLELALVSEGIEVIALICGEVDQVINAFLTGQLHQKIY
ncbi:MAG: NifB/NifX family molybdenum-iron cluster-binding protein, partial [Candidatus Hinthialibacter sp.]